MTGLAYYNEFDKYAAKWLRNLINAGLIVPGIVDERSIEDVRPDDLDGFTQCHFFAGLGGWSYALRTAGWADHRPIWTASCPCQPYSQAGQGGGFDDERHLWPHFEHILREQKRRPAIVLGEQVASSFADPWIDLVHADVEALGYAFGCVPFPSAGVGAPHIRDRNYWLAHADSEQQRQGRQRGTGFELAPGGRYEGSTAVAGFRATLRVVDSDHPRLEGRGQSECGRGNEQSFGSAGLAGGLAYAANLGQLGRRSSSPSDGRDAPRFEPERFCDVGEPVLSGPTNGPWRDADWLACRDGKWRPVEPGTFPLAYGVAGRVGRLRAYGNAINVEAARVFIQTVMTVVD